MSRPGPKPKKRINVRWRPELAYAVGLITADGSLSKNRRHINFTSKDKQLIQVYRDCLNLHDIKIGKKCSGSNKCKEYYQIQFGDVHFYNWLENIGLFSNKSKTITKVNVPEEYFFDFLRGEWDGDGTIYRIQDKRWKSSYLIILGFASGSYEFLEWLQTEINFRLDTSGHISRSTHMSFQLRYARKDSKKIFDAMFQNKKVPCLKRKFAKGEKIFRIDRLNSLN